MIEKLIIYEDNIKYKIKIHEEGINSNNFDYFSKKINYYKIILEEIKWLNYQFNNENRTRYN